LLLLAALGCERAASPDELVPLRRLADEAARRANMREPATFALGEDTRYVLAPPSEALIDTEVLHADDAGVMHERDVSASAS
jgi:hypothetical protein